MEPNVMKIYILILLCIVVMVVMFVLPLDKELSEQEKYCKNQNRGNFSDCMKQYDNYLLADEFMK